MRLSVDRFLPFSASIFACALLSGCGGAARAEFPSAPVTAGPGADYPMVLGASFTIDGVTYTPADKMNVDQVGYAYADSEGGTGITAAHRTLPLPSYAEVTSLDTGKTILVRVVRRGPMSGDGLVGLSAGAAAQLGADPAGRTPVRVRRVNPPEIERSALRRGEQAPERMETPKSLVAVLLRKLNPSLSGAPSVPGTTPPANLAAIAAAGKAPQLAPAAAKPAPATTRPVPEAARPVAAKPATAKPVTSASAAAKPAASPAPATAPAAQRGRSVVQVGAFSVKANAEATAAKVGGSVSASGRLWRVQMGPYSVQGEAAAALAKARGAGYSDARIQRAD